MHPLDLALGCPVLRATAHELILIKPAGLASEHTRDADADAVVSRVRRALPDTTPRLPHRLDRATRGILVVALSADAAAHYGREIREGHWEKWYLARIPWPPPETASPDLIRTSSLVNPSLLATRPSPALSEVKGLLVGLHKAYLATEGKRAKLVRSGGKPSQLEIVAVDEAPGRESEAHVVIRLLTGRFHQIRVMLAGLSVPLIGDDLYGGRPGSLYLEHVILRCRPFGETEPQIFYQKNDPDREALAPSIRSKLRDIAAGPA